MELAELPLQSQMDRFFGNPRGPGGGEVSRSWYAANIVRVPAPWLMNMGNIRIRELTVHRKMAPRLSAMLAEIRALAVKTAAPNAGIIPNAPEADPNKVQDVLDYWGMSEYGGGYNYRVKRGNSTSLSTHAYGIAWDFDPADNGFRDQTPRFLQFPELCAVFRKFGVWGGDWSTGSRDGMHIQFAKVG